MSNREKKMAMAFNAMTYYIEGYRKGLEGTDGWSQKSAVDVMLDVKNVIFEMWDEIDADDKKEDF